MTMVAYDQMKHQIQKEISDYLEANPEKINPEKPKQLYDPFFSCQQGTTEITLYADRLSSGNFLSAVDLLKRYYQNFSKLRAYYGTNYELTAELQDTTWAYKKPTDDEKKKNEMEVEFKFDSYISSLEEVVNGGLKGFDKTNIVKFKKKDELKQEEINCVIDFWKKYVIDDEKRKVDPLQELKDLGAIVYEAKGELKWENLAGYEGLKQQIKDTVILPFKHPDVYNEITKFTRTKDSKNIVQAVLFEGPPGTGKTMSAKIIGNELDVPLVYVPIESIMSCWYGVAEKRLASIFGYCSQLEKAIIFLDEIDALAGSRDKEMHESTRRILSVLLREIDGFASSNNVLTIGATNTVSSLDHALISRFDRVLTFPLPNANERAAIFKYYAKQLGNDGIQQLANETKGNSGRDIEDMCADAERVWARKVISGNLEVSPPPLEAYIQALKQSKKILKKQERKVMGFNTK